MPNASKSLITDELRAAIGMEWPPITSCDPVQSSEVRRFTQATMDASRIYYDEAYARERKYGGLTAPGSFPITFPRRRAPGTPDPVVPGPGVSQAEAAIGRAGPQIPWPPQLKVFHAYSDLEIYEHARLGDRITMRRRIVDVHERTGRRGLLLFVVTENVFTNQDGDVLCTERYVDVGHE
jgi:hydroxyacyl-ACP dehydratase HTD2-like protein with hotdog domain